MIRRSLRMLPPALALFLGACGAVRPVAHGPFLLRPTQRSLCIAARTWQEMRLRLDVLSLSGAPEVSYEDSAPARRHVYPIEGLEPSTRHAYRLSVLEGGTERLLDEGTAATAPSDPSQPIRVVAIGDSGILGLFRPKMEGRIAEEAAKFRPDLFLHLGDIVYSQGGDPTAEFSEAFFEPCRGLLKDVPVYPTPGNHDQAIAEGDAYDTFFELPDGEGGRWYSFDYGPVHFASLDTSTLRGFTRPQVEWLERDLRASSAPWKVIFTHHPPIGANGDGQIDDPAVLAPILDAAKRGGVRLILVGHEHAYLRYKPLGDEAIAPLLIVSGGGGATLSRTVGPDARLLTRAIRYHHLRLSISASRMEIEAVGLGEEVFDRVALDR